MIWRRKLLTLWSALLSGVGEVIASDFRGCGLVLGLAGSYRRGRLARKVLLGPARVWGFMTVTNQDAPMF